MNRRASLRQDDAAIVHLRRSHPLHAGSFCAARSSHSTAEGTASWSRTRPQMRRRAVMTRTGCSCGELPRHVGSRPLRTPRRCPPRTGYCPVHPTSCSENRASYPPIRGWGARRGTSPRTVARFTDHQLQARNLRPRSAHRPLHAKHCGPPVSCPAGAVTPHESRGESADQDKNINRSNTRA